MQAEMMAACPEGEWKGQLADVARRVEVRECTRHADEGSAALLVDAEVSLRNGTVVDVQQTGAFEDGTGAIDNRIVVCRGRECVAIRTTECWPGDARDMFCSVHSREPACEHGHVFETQRPNDGRQKRSGYECDMENITALFDYLGIDVFREPQLARVLMMFGMRQRACSYLIRRIERCARRQREVLLAVRATDLLVANEMEELVVSYLPIWMHDMDPSNKVQGWTYEQSWDVSNGSGSDSERKDDDDDGGLFDSI
eukprot:TRINITY_DN47160_c0_g1_i1.p1 TRINITY_DN47160_c0_g1~~TRINITY_DN47160_c0_g1_i1.p1  ORF type:complete len:282 (+),score=107.23 TRINITY_DN47160_c0_g1_i1:81-848(+)